MNQDPALEKLKELQQEFAKHKARLRERAKQIREKSIEPAEAVGLIAELFDEFVDTALSFQADLVDTLVEDFENADSDPDEGDIASVLLPEDADQLAEALTEMVSLIDGMIGQPNLPEADRERLVKGLTPGRKLATDGLELVEQLRFDPDADDSAGPEETTDSN